MKAVNLRKLKPFDVLMILLGVGVIVLGANIFITKITISKTSDSWVIVDLRLDNQPPWVDEAIKIGSSELSGRREIARIVDKKSVPAESLSRFEINRIRSGQDQGSPVLSFYLPAYKNSRDIIVRVKLLAKQNSQQGMKFKEGFIKVDEPIEINTSPRRIYIIT